MRAGRIALWLLVACLAPGPVIAAGLQAGAEQAYQQGNRAYQAGHFTEAVRLYDWARATGWVSPELEFNQANARLKSGHLGLAIAGYERARRMGLDEPDVVASLKYARGLTRDPRPSEETSKLVTVTGRIVEAVPAEGLFIAGWLVLVLAAALWVWGRMRSRTGLGTWIGAGLAVGIFLQASGVARQLYVDQDRRGVILGVEVPVRSGPGIDFPAPYALHEGATVRIGRAAGPWREIELSSDVVGWVLAGSLEPI